MKFQVESIFYNAEQMCQLISAQGRFGKRTIYYVMGAAMLVLCLIVLWPQIRDGNVTSALTGLAGLAALYAFYMYRLRHCKPTDRSTLRTVRKSAKFMAGRLEKRTYTFQDDLFTVTGNRGTEQVSYGDLLRTAESNYCFILQIQRGFFIVPKEAFTAGDPAEFGAFMQEKTGKAVIRLDY